MKKLKTLTDLRFKANRDPDVREAVMMTASSYYGWADPGPSVNIFTRVEAALKELSQHNEDDVCRDVHNVRLHRKGQ